MWIVYNNFPLEVTVPSKTALLHGLLNGLRIDIFIYICISKRNYFVV